MLQIFGKFGSERYKDIFVKNGESKRSVTYRGEEERQRGEECEKKGAGEEFKSKN